MCGIAGFIDLNGANLVAERDVPLLRNLARQIAHRGPDDEQIFLWRNVGLAFRRLSIVDPAGGSQPLFNEDRTIVVVCNGEIYNHKDLRNRFADNHCFRSGSDCEVIPHIYEQMGMTLLDYLNGTFAFALLDKTKDKIFLSRDRLGVKPLFYYKDKDLLVFGSEVKGSSRPPRCCQEIRLDSSADISKPDALSASDARSHIVFPRCARALRPAPLSFSDDENKFAKAAAVISHPSQSLISARTGKQIGPGRPVRVRVVR